MRCDPNNDGTKSIVAKAGREHLESHGLGQHGRISAAPGADHAQRELRNVRWRRPQPCGSQFVLDMRASRHRRSLRSVGRLGQCSVIHVYRLEYASVCEFELLVHHAQCTPARVSG